MEGKYVSESRVTIPHQVLPHQTNNAGKMHGGELLRLLDSAGAICAFRHARGKLVTAAIEHMEFIAPICPGDIVLFHCSVNAVRRTSMEVGVRIEAEDYLTGAIRHVSTGYLTFVGIDDTGKPRPLPPLKAETDEDRRRMADAARRMAISRVSRLGLCDGKESCSLLELTDSFAFVQGPADGPLPTIPAGKLFGMVRSEDTVFYVLKEEDLHLLAPACHTNVQSGYCCVTVNETMDPDGVGFVASISAVLASVRVPVFLLSTLHTNFIFFPGEKREQALLALTSVGYQVS